MKYRVLPAVIACFFFVSAAAAVMAEETSSVRGLYTKVPGGQFSYDGKTVEIIEFLSFYCSHCYKFEKAIPVIKGNFPKKIRWTTVPIYWGKGSPKPGEAYFLAEEAGRGEEMKKAIFNAVFVEGKDIGDMNVLEEIGVKAGLGFDFSRRLRAGDKAKEAAAATAMADRYHVQETPTLIIAGNIMTGPGQVGGDMDKFRDNAIAILISILKP